VISSALLDPCNGFPCIWKRRVNASKVFQIRERVDEIALLFPRQSPAVKGSNVLGINCDGLTEIVYRFVVFL
jgi:hypothetical protein